MKVKKISFARFEAEMCFGDKNTFVRTLKGTSEINTVLRSLFRQGFDSDDGPQLYPQQQRRLSLPLDRSSE